MYSHKTATFVTAVSHIKGRTKTEGVQKQDVQEKLHNEELHDLYSSSNNIRMINSRKMRGMRRVVHTGETRNKNFGRKTYKSLGRHRHRLKNTEMVL